jgi:erythromycin esterase
MCLLLRNDFFFTNYEWELVKSGALPVDRFVGTAINTLWTHCTVLNHFFREYLPSTLRSGTSLEITGFDSQMNTKRLVPMLDSVLQSLKIPMVQLPEYKNKILPLLTTWYNYANDTSACNKIIGHYTAIRTEMLDKLSKDDFWVVAVENCIQLVTQYKYRKKDFAQMNNIRDRQMAANLKWLATRKYPTEKIIVWAHNFHISKYAGHYPVKWANAFNTMGNVFTSDTAAMRRTYVLGFTSYQGTAGRLRTKTYKIEKPKPNSFENWIDKDYQYAFVDFKEFNILNPRISQVFNMSGATLGNNRYHTNYPAEWNKIFDGVFYIRDMYACER